MQTLTFALLIWRSSLLDLPPIRIMRQPVEYAISDKIHAAYQHGGRSTRLRDAYDLYVFLTKCSVDDDRLRGAFERSWPIYGSELPVSVEEIEGLSSEWAATNEKAWAALRASSSWAVEVPSLGEVVQLIRSRIEPVIGNIHTHRIAA